MSKIKFYQWHLKKGVYGHSYVYPHVIFFKTQQVFIEDMMTIYMILN